MSLTLAQIQSQVRLLTQESQTPAFATDANVLMFANQAQLEIASRTKAKVVSNLPNSTANPTLTTTAGVRLYSIPTNIMDIYEVIVNYYKCYLVKENDLYSFGGPLFWKIQGMPRYYYFEDDNGEKKLGLWMTPGGSWNVEVKGVKRPTDMALSTSVPDLDERLHQAVVFRVAQRIMESRREFDKAQYWNGEYEKQVYQYETSGRDSNEHTYFLDTAIPSD